jgi:hypothetical protein
MEGRLAPKIHRTTPSSPLDGRSAWFLQVAAWAAADLSLAFRDADGDSGCEAGGIPEGTVTAPFTGDVVVKVGWLAAMPAAAAAFVWIDGTCCANATNGSDPTEARNKYAFI